MKPGTFSIDDGRVGARAFVDVGAYAGSREHRDHVVEQIAMRCGRSALKMLHDYGYPCDLFVVLNTAQITVTDVDDGMRLGLYVTLRYPHTGIRDADELTPDRAVEVELYGGPLDGKVHTVKINDGGFLVCIPPQLPYADRLDEMSAAATPQPIVHEQVIYRRAGIEPSTGRFIYTTTGR